MMGKRFDLIVIGELNADLILTGDVVPQFGQAEKLIDDAVLSLGSSSAIFACGVARLGLKVGFISKIGDDQFGRFLISKLRDYAIDTSQIVVEPSIRTGLTVILSGKDDRAMLTYPGTIPLLERHEIDADYLARGRHLHLGSYFLLSRLRPHIPALFDLAHSLGMSVSMDTNYDPDESWDGGLQDAMIRTDVFMPNEAECKAISMEKDLFMAMQRLARFVGLLAVKNGAQGALAQRGMESYRAEALKVHVADTVGAGDSFDAGFIYGWLSGWEVQRCLQLAVVCGSLSTQKPGGIAGQPHLRDAMKYLQD